MKNSQSYQKQTETLPKLEPSQVEIIEGRCSPIFIQLFETKKLVNSAHPSDLLNLSMLLSARVGAYVYFRQVHRLMLFYIQIIGLEEMGLQTKRRPNGNDK